MDMALLIAKSGLDAQHRNIEVISNNLANSGTNSFKRNRAEFEDLPYQVITQTGAPTTQEASAPSGLLVGTGTRLSNNKKIFQEGTQLQTGGALDISISGRGFLRIQLPSGNFSYTRDGSLSINNVGQLVTKLGYIVQPPVTIPQGTTNIAISQDGLITATTNNDPNTTQQLGQLQLTDFVNTDGLLPIGENMYLQTVASGVGVDGNPMDNGLGALKQGTLEGSNVNIVEEMVNLIEAQRAFEVTSKAVSAVDGMLQTLTREI